MGEYDDLHYDPPTPRKQVALEAENKRLKAAIAKAHRKAIEQAAKVAEELARDASIVDCELDGEKVAAAIRALARRN